jgi:hypothetical protein
VNLTEIQGRFVGEWSGENLLLLGSEASLHYLSPTKMSVSLAAKGRALTFAYTWSHEDVPHEGLAVVGYDSRQSVATAAWIDSFHMSTKMMSFVGTIDQLGAVDVRGSYEAPPGPDWGWRIVFTPTDDGMQMVMYNITPQGEEDLAVRADYKRS